MQKISLGPPQKSTITSPYNTAEGIAKSLVSLTDFQNLLTERYIAGYERDENLTIFYVMGNFYLDSCGNCMKADRDIKKIYPSIPDVLNSEEYWKFMEENAADKQKPMIGFSMASIPPANIVCPVCQKSWTLEDCYDFVEYTGADSEKNISLKDYVGKTLYDVQMIFNERTDAIYRINQPELIIRNDRFIDLAPNPDYADYNNENPQSPMVINRRGWVGEKQGINGNYVVQEGDDGYFNIWRYYHRACNHQRLNEEALIQFTRIFEKAGFKELDVRLLETPNQYYQCDYYACWFNVNTIYGTGILIGWRKRVINIDWSQWGYDFSYLFPDEDVTKWKNGIHAWGEDKAIEYLSKIVQEIKAKKKIQNIIRKHTTPKKK